MAYNNGIDGKALLDEISKVIDAAANQYREAGQEAGEAFAEGVIEGVKKHSKDTKSEITKMFESFNKMTNAFKTRKSISNSEWNKVLQLSQELLKSERYADNVREKIGDIAVEFKNIGKVSGLENVLKELAKAENTIESVSWSEASKNYRKKSSTKKATTKKPKVETPTVQADPTPVANAEEKKQKAIEETTAALHEQESAAQGVTQAVKEAADVIKSENGGRPLKIFDLSNMTPQTRRKELREIKEFAKAKWQYAIGEMQEMPTGWANFIKKDGSSFEIMGDYVHMYDKSGKTAVKALSDMSKSAFEKLMSNLTYAIFEDEERMLSGGDKIKERLIDSQSGDLSSYIAKDNEIYRESRQYVAAYREEVQKLHGALHIEDDDRKRLSSEEAAKYEELASNAEDVRKYYEERQRIEREAYAKQREFDELEDPITTWQSGPKDGQESMFESDADREIKLLEARVEYHKKRKQLIQESSDLAKEYQNLPLQRVSPDNLIIQDSSVGDEQGYIDHYGEQLQYRKDQLVRTVDSYEQVVEKLQEYVALKKKIAELYNAGEDTSEYQKSLRTIRNQLTAGMTDTKERDSIIAAMELTGHLPNFKFDDMANRISGALKIQDTTAAIKNQTKALNEQEAATENVSNAQEKYNQRMSEIKDKYSGKISEQKALIANQEDWIKYLNGSLDESKFKTTGKKAATDQLRSLTNYMVNSRRDNYKNASGEYAKEMAEVAWMRGYQEAERQGVAQSVLNRFDTDARYDFDRNLKTLQDEYNDRKKRMDEAHAELQRLYLERDKEAFSAFTDKLMPDGPQSDEENRILSEITEQVANKILSFTEAKEKLENSIMTLRNMASSEAKVNLQNLVNDLKKTYDTETFDKVFGADFGMFASFDKIDDAGAKELYAMLIESNEKYQASLVESTAAQSKLNDELQETNILYHAGDLSDPSKTQKTYPLGHVRPGKSYGVFNGFTGLYTTEDVDGFWGNEWSGAPISTIDASQYKLFDARTDELATKAKDFFDQLNGTIYGYIEDFATGEIEKTTDVKSVDELWVNFKEVFTNVEMTFEQFSEFVKKAQNLVHGKSFDYKEGLPALDEAVIKTGDASSLQGVSKEVFNSDSFQTQLLKMLGFEGIDLRGTRYNGTYTGGTVLFEVKPESIKTTNEKWSDVMTSHGYEIDESGLKHEEKRRQLAFDTAKAYSQQADAATDVVLAQKQLNGEIESSQSQTIGQSLLELENITGLTITEVLSNYDSLDSGIKEKANSILQSIGLMNDQMELTFSKSRGGNAKAVIGSDFVILQKSIENSSEYSDNLISKLNEARQLGINVAPVLERVFSALPDNFNSFVNDMYTPGYEVQTRAPGKDIHINQRAAGAKDLNKALEENATILSAADDQLIKFINDYIQLDRIGIEVDPNPFNFLYDAEKGFSFIDLSLKRVDKQAKTIYDVFKEMTAFLANTAGFNALDQNDDLGISSGQVVYKVANAFETMGLATRAELDEWVKGLYDGFGTIYNGYTGKPSSIQQVTDAAEQSKKSLQDVLELINKMSTASGDIDAFNQRHKSLIDKASQLTSGADYDQLYNQLIENENKYQQEVEETNRINKEREGHLDAYAEAAGAFLSDNKYDSISYDDKNKLFEEFGNKIMQEGISGSEAMDQLYLSMERLLEKSKEMPDDILDSFGTENEHVAETVSNLQKLSSIDLTRIFDSVDLKAFLAMFNIDESNAQTFRTLFEELMQITKAMSNGVDVGNAFDVKMTEITDTIMRLGGHMVDLDDGGYATMMKEFYKHMSNTKVQFNDAIKADYTKDQWKSLYGTYKNRLTADLTKGIAADSLYHELSGLFPSLFPEGVLNQQDQFKLIFEKLGEARQLQANNWKVLQGFVSSDRDDIQNQVDNVYGQMSDALFADDSSVKLQTEADSFKDVEQSATKAANAKGKFSQENKKLGAGADESSDSLDDEADSLENVNRAAANMPDVSAYDSTTVRIGADGRPYSVSGTATTEMVDGSHVRTTDTYSFNDDNNRWDYDGSVQSTERTREMVQALEEYYRILIQIQKLSLDTSGTIHAEEINKLETEDLVRAQQRLLNLGVQVNDIEGQINLSVNQRQALLDVELHARQQMYDIIAKMEDKQATDATKPYQKTVRDELNKASDIDTNVRLLGDNGASDKLQDKITQYRQLVDELVDLRLQLARNPDLANNVDFSNNFADTAKRAQNLRAEIEGVFKESQKLQKLGTLIETGDKDVSKVKDLKSAMIEFASSTFGSDAKIQGFNKAGDQMYVTLNKGAGAVENITVALNSANGHLQAFSTGTAKATNEWEDFKTQAVAGAKNLIGMYVGFQEGVQAVRTGLNYVKEIDLAMTELKKVTDETDASYKQFLQDAGSTSAVIGSTISDFTEATATFARLGYSMEESSSMAETAIIYKNVADGLDSVEESSESIISTMMAFGIEANDTMSIIDRFNAVGNNFAITSAGIGEALQRSASALYSAGNTIDESVALVTAANSVIQNPEQVGTALKTLALRLRGAKTELEEAGLETDNMAESTSTLQAKLNALTHGKVDIMLDADTFKSTTQILREMSEAWEDMTDIERASALELMGGKRQANILASVITNFETVEDVIETSMNSSGSAMAENEKWLDSIEGKTYQFTNALQTMWSNMLDSEMIKGFIDFGTEAIQFLDTGAGKVIALVAALKLMAKFKGFSLSGIVQGLGDTINKITTAQQTLQTLTQTTKVGQGYDLTNVNAYAQAVSNLTAKQQANLLASQGLNREQIRYALTLNQVDDASMREAMAHVHATTAKQQENAVTAQSIQQKAQELAMSLRTQAATADETRAKELNVVADILENSTSEEAIANNLQEAITSKGVSASLVAETTSTLGLTTAKKGLLATTKALMIANPVGFWLTVGSTILSLIPIVSELVDTFTQSAEEIKQEAEEITQAYSDAINDVNSNLESLGITNDSASIGALEKEFATLTAGVDKYGNNLSLTSDEYERYREICEQIVGINPQIARGYDSATEAIGNNARILSELIDLQREQVRIAAEEYVNDENLEILSENAVNDWKESNKAVAEANMSLRNELTGYFNNLLNYKDNNGNNYYNDDTIQYVLEKLGYDAKTINKTITNYWNQALGDYDISRFWSDYSDEVKNSVDKFGIEHANNLSNIFSSAEIELDAAKSRLEEKRDGLIDTLLEVPVSSKDYGKLSSEGKNFLVDWIKNSEMFKVDGEVDEEDAQAMRDAILNMMDILVSDAKNIEYNGEKFTAQGLLSKIYNLDPSSIDYSEYKKQINEMLTVFWNSLTEDQKKEYGFEKFEDFTISLGFDFVVDEKSETDMINRYRTIKGISEEDARAYFNSLPAAVVQRLLKIDWNLVDENNIDETIANAKGGLSNIISSKTYSVLAESVESYNNILTQTAEIAADNTEVTQEYKDSLADLGISQEDLNECFDEANPLIVKNAKALNKLVKEANKNVAANVKLAKSNARLDYYQLVKQLGATLDGTKKLDDATRESIYSTLEQIDAVEQALYKYQLLEDTLLGVNNAFDKFAEAQEIDSLNTYGDSYVEMAQTMYDALYKTGQVGTEAFWSSVEALVPTEVYQSLTDDADRMKAIYDYYNKNILPSLKLDEDNLSLDYDAVENFVNEGLDAGVFTGDIESFDLVEGMNLEKAAELMGMTETQAYALFAELDKYNTAGNEHSFLSQLDDSLEGRITNITNDVENLNKQKLALLEDGGYEKNKEAIDEINEKLTQSEAELNKLSQEAYNTWQEYTKNDAVIAALSEVEDKTAFLTEEGAKSLGLEWDEVKGQTVQQALDNLLAKQLELEEPTVLTAQLAIDSIDSQIAALKQKLKDSEKDPTVLGVEADADQTTIDAAKQKIQDQIQALEEDMVVLSTTFGIELSEEQKATVQDELNAVEQFVINDKSFYVIVNGTSETMQALQKVQDYQIGDKSYTVTEKFQSVGAGTNYETARIRNSGGRYTKVDGTAHSYGTAYKNGSWGVPKTETALVGELGPEMLVRNGRWTTIGDNGAEFTQVKKGDIIFNHKQTESLLKNGYVTGRGKAYASGTAYSGLWNPTSPDKSQSNKPGNDFSDAGNRLFNAADSVSGAANSLSSAANALSDSSDEFKEVFDWIEVRLEEINEDISLKGAKLENEIGYKNQNKVVDSMINLNQKLYDNLIAGAAEYNAFAKELLKKVPSEYRKAAQDGTIAIETFVGEVDEKTLEAIQNYREWVQKGADLTQRAEETLTEISNLAKQAIDNIASDFENKTSLNDSQIAQLEAYNALLETDKGFESEDVYSAIIKATNANIKKLKEQRNAMQAELNSQVEAGNIEKYSQNWYDAVNAISEVDTQIIELTADTEDYQDAINELHWDKFDALMSQYEAISDEAENLIDILGSKDLVDKDTAKWTDEGITVLGLYAQQMEVAEMQAKKYEEEIAYLNKNWKKLGYTETEYVEKLEELKSGQYDAIKAYNDTKDAIVDLNKERVDAIKEGIEKEIEAYEELIEKKKEELDAEKDLYDFQKGVADQQKEIADIERKLAALSADNSASARAQRAQLQAELAKAQAELEETYYDRSISDQQEALDKELENFQETKDKEMEGLDEYLENTELVVSDSLSTVQANTELIYNTLQAMGKEYSLSIAEYITSPWTDGENAIQSFSEKFGLSMSAIVDRLKELALEFKETMLEIERAGIDATDNVAENAQKYTNTDYQESKKETSGGSSSKSSSNSSKSSSSTTGLVSSLSGNIQYGQSGANVKKLQQALNELGYGNSGTSGLDGVFGQKTLEAVKKFQSAMGISADGIVGSETKKKFKIKGYSIGSKGLDEDQLALIDELGEELRLIPDGNGRLSYMKKGTGIIPADLTENLMGWGTIDPSDMLERSKPQIGVSPSVVNNTMEIHVDASVGELIHVEHLDGNNPAEITKIVDKAWDKHMKELNAHVRRYTNR